MSVRSVMVSNSLGSWAYDSYDSTRGFHIVDGAFDGSGNLFTVGWGQNPALLTSELSALLKIDASGTVLASTALGDADEHIAAVAISGTDVYVGASLAWISPSYGTAVVKLDSNLSTIAWQRGLTNTTGYTEFAHLAVSSTAIYAVGSDQTPFGSNVVVFICKYNLSGVLQWQKRFPLLLLGSSAEICVAVEPSSGDLIVGGAGSSSGYATMMRVTAAGAVTWAYSLGNDTSTYSDVRVSGSTITALARGSVGGTARMLIINMDLSGTITSSFATTAISGYTYRISGASTAPIVSYSDGTGVIWTQLDGAYSATMTRRVAPTIGSFSSYLPSVKYFGSGTNVYALCSTVGDGLVIALPVDGTGAGSGLFFTQNSGSVQFTAPTAITTATVTKTNTSTSITPSNTGYTDSATAMTLRTNPWTLTRKVF